MSERTNELIRPVAVRWYRNEMWVLLDMSKLLDVSGDLGKRWGRAMDYDDGASGYDSICRVPPWEDGA